MRDEPARPVAVEVYSVTGYEELFLIPRYDSSNLLEVLLTSKWEAAALAEVLREGFERAAKARGGGRPDVLLRFLKFRSEKRLVRCGQMVSARLDAGGALSYFPWLRGKKFMGWTAPKGAEYHAVGSLDELGSEILGYLDGLKGVGVAELL